MGVRTWPATVMLRCDKDETCLRLVKQCDGVMELPCIRKQLAPKRTGCLGGAAYDKCMHGHICYNEWARGGP